MVALWFPGVTCARSGADGPAAGVTELLALEGSEVPTLLLATTVKVYAVPFVRPVMVQVVSGATAVQVRPPGDEVTM